MAYSPATPSASIFSIQGMKMAALEQSWSVMVRIESYPWDSGSLTIKSIVIVWKGRAFGSVVMGKVGGLIG